MRSSDMKKAQMKGTHRWEEICSINLPLPLSETSMRKIQSSVVSWHLLLRSLCYLSLTYTNTFSSAPMAPGLVPSIE